jgi:hypothetical protein
LLRELGMHDLEDVHSDLKRLRSALEALSADLDSIEQRHHYPLQLAAKNLTGERSHGIEDAVSNFAVAIERAR